MAWKWGKGGTGWRQGRLCMTCIWFESAGLGGTGTPDRGTCVAPELKKYDLAVDGRERPCQYYREANAS